MKRPLSLALGCCALAAASPATGQKMDDSAVRSACGAVDADVAAGRVPAAAAVACGNREAARQLSAQMPMRIDEITTVESVEARGTEFLYNVRVAVASADVPAQAREALSASTRANVCGNSDMRITIGHGGSYRYRWTGSDGGRIGELLIRSC